MISIINRIVPHVTHTAREYVSSVKEHLINPVDSILTKPATYAFYLAGGGWRDPVSIETVLKITRPIEDLTHSLSQRLPSAGGLMVGMYLDSLRKEPEKDAWVHRATCAVHNGALSGAKILYERYLMNMEDPAKDPVHYLSKALIGLAQPIHAFISTTNRLLDLPKDLKEYAAAASVTKVADAIFGRFGRSWTLLKACMRFVKDVAFKTISVTAKVFDEIVIRITGNKDFKLLKATYRATAAKVRSVRRGILQRVHDKIDAKTGEIRRSVVRAIASKVWDNCGLELFKGVIGYELDIPYTIAGVVGVLAGDISWLAAVTGLSIKSIKPRLDKYADAYTSGYKPEDPKHLQDFCERFGVPYLPVNTLLRKVEKRKKRLQAKAARAG